MQATLFYDEIKEDIMPLNEADRAWVGQEIQVAHRRNGWGKLAGFIKDWSGASASVGILIFLATQWTGYVEFRTKTGDRLDNIESTLKQLGRDQTKQGLISQSFLPSAEFKASLPDLASTVAKATRERVEVSPQVVDTLAQKLSETDKDAPGFWKTTSEVINYRSFLSSPQQYIAIRLPNCDPHPARDLTIRTPQKDGTVETLTQRNAVSIIQEKCFLDLDEHNVIEEYQCSQCVVKYSGGPLTLKGQVEFKDCLFVFSINSQPPTPSGQLLAESLISQNPLDVKIPRT